MARLKVTKVDFRKIRSGEGQIIDAEYTNGAGLFSRSKQKEGEFYGVKIKDGEGIQVECDNCGEKTDAVAMVGMTGTKIVIANPKGVRQR
ncbi:MAG: hypothetical protein FWG80_03070 [Alphaproteobacteria bacterium]|nr:hypothetical protein [Alphaproteobacteria bacterium]